jgi:hypothetical protein
MTEEDEEFNRIEREAAMRKEAVTAVLGAPVHEPDTYGYAKRLAEAIWEKHYKSTAPQWEPLDCLIGVLTQIDNMTSGLTTPPATPVQEPDHGDELTIAYMSGLQRGKDFAAQRQWVGLTDEDKHDIELKAGITEDDDGYIVSQMFKLIEAKLKEKNA